jgi:hypothetical protein
MNKPLTRDGWEYTPGMPLFFDVSIGVISPLLGRALETTDEEAQLDPDLGWYAIWAGRPGGGPVFVDGMYACQSNAIVDAIHELDRDYTRCRAYLERELERLLEEENA